MTEERTIWRDPVMEEIQRRRKHLELLEGAKLKADFEALNTSVFILSGNGQDLSELASKFSGTGVNVRQLPEHFSDEFSRRLHNLLGSAKSLMEVQRAVGNRWWGKESEFMSTERVAAVRRAYVEDETSFLYKLRDYALHLGSPRLSIATTIRAEGGGPVIQENSIRIRRPELLAWSGWNGAARGFLEKQKDEFEIFGVIERYFKAVTDYHFWFWRSLESHCRQIIDEHEEKAQELFLWSEEFAAFPEWLRDGLDAPPLGWSARKFRAEKTMARYAYGSKGFRTISVDTTGSAIPGDSSGWDPLPRKIDRARRD